MQTQLNITGMHCASCKALLEDVAKDFSQVKSVDVNPEKGTMTLEHDPGLSLSDLQKEIEGLGDYHVSDFSSHENNNL